MHITRSRILQKLGADNIDTYPPVRADIECNFVIQVVIKYVQSNVQSVHRNGHYNPLTTFGNLIKNIVNKNFSVINCLQIAIEKNSCVTIFNLKKKYKLFSNKNL